MTRHAEREGGREGGTEGRRERQVSLMVLSNSNL